MAFSCLRLFPIITILLALIFMTFVFLGQYSSSSSFFTSIYFERLNTQNLTVGSTGIEAQALKFVTGIQDHYDVGMYNYCSGGKNGSTYCSPRQAAYAFDPLTVLGIEGTPLEGASPETWNNELDKYRTAVKWYFAAYIVALSFQILTLVLSVLAMFAGRITAWLACLAAGLASFFAIGASATALATYLIVGHYIQDNLKEWGVTYSIGTNMQAFSWVSAAMSLCTFFWALVSSCRTQLSKKSRPNYGQSRGIPVGDDDKDAFGLGMNLKRGNTWGNLLRGATPYQRIDGNTNPAPYESQFQDNVPLHNAGAPLGDVEREPLHAYPEGPNAYNSSTTNTKASEASNYYNNTEDYSYVPGSQNTAYEPYRSN